MPAAAIGSSGTSVYSSVALPLRSKTLGEAQEFRLGESPAAGRPAGARVATVVRPQRRRRMTAHSKAHVEAAAVLSSKPTRVDSRLARIRPAAAFPRAVHLARARSARATDP